MKKNTRKEGLSGGALPGSLFSYLGLHPYFFILPHYPTTSAWLKTLFQKFYLRTNETIPTPQLYFRKKIVLPTKLEPTDSIPFKRPFPFYEFHQIIAREGLH